MGKKYIKGRDGKFRGSVPDGLSVPQAVKEPPARPQGVGLANSHGEGPNGGIAIAAAYENFKTATEARDFEIAQWRDDTGGAALFINNRVDDISGTVMESDAGDFTATVDMQYLDRSSTVAAKTFSRPTEAEDWVKERLASYANEISEFDSAYEEDAISLNDSVSRTLKASHSWVEQSDSTFGPPTGWMRGAVRGATVQRLGASGYLVSVHDYKNDADTEGSLYSSRHLPDFDSAWSFAKFLCAKTA